MQVYLSGAKFQSVPSPPGAGAKESADLEKSRVLLAGLVEDTGSIPMPDGSQRSVTPVPGVDALFWPPRAPSKVDRGRLRQNNHVHKNK